MILALPVVDPGMPGSNRHPLVTRGESMETAAKKTTRSAALRPRPRDDAVKW